jgi:hypothetical protein
MTNPKPGAAALGVAIATLLWILLPVFVDSLGRLSAEGIAGATTASAVLLGALLFWFVPQEGEPPDPKFAWAAVGAAAGAMLWILLPNYFADIAGMSEEAIAGATSASAAILGALFYYFVPRSRMATSAIRHPE